jgi:hypothetical protein
MLIIVVDNGFSATMCRAHCFVVVNFFDTLSRVGRRRHGAQLKLIFQRDNREFCMISRAAAIIWIRVIWLQGLRGL